MEQSSTCRFPTSSHPFDQPLTSVQPLNCCPTIVSTPPAKQNHVIRIVDCQVSCQGVGREAFKLFAPVTLPDLHFARRHAPFDQKNGPECRSPKMSLYPINRHSRQSSVGGLGRRPNLGDRAHPCGSTFLDDRMNRMFNTWAAHQFGRHRDQFNLALVQNVLRFRPQLENPWHSSCVVGLH